MATTTPVPTTTAAPTTTVAPAVPVLELIAQDIQAKINAITEVGGWEQTLVAVRPTRMGFEGNAMPEDLNVLVVQDDPDEDEEHSAEGNVCSKAWIQPFLLIAFVIASDSSEVAIDTRINSVQADIQKKLMEDITRDGLAFDTRIRGSARFNESPNFTGVVVRADVFYRTRENDPYEIA